MTNKQRTFLEWIYVGVEPVEAYRGAYNVGSRGSGELLRRAQAVIDSPAGQAYLQELRRKDGMGQKNAAASAGSQTLAGGGTNTSQAPAPGKESDSLAAGRFFVMPGEKESCIEADGKIQGLETGAAASSRSEGACKKASNEADGTGQELVFGLPPQEMLEKIRELERVMEAAKGYEFPAFSPQGGKKKPPLSEQEVIAGLRDLKDKCLGLKPVLDVKGAVFNPSGANRALELLGRYLGIFERHEEPGEDPYEKLDRILREIDKEAGSETKD